MQLEHLTAIAGYVGREPIDPALLRAVTSSFVASTCTP
jgi:hypothetical protein